MTKAPEMLRVWLFRLLMRLSPSRRLGELRLYDVSHRSRQGGGRLDKLEAALQRIEEVSPGLMMRVRNHAQRIVIVSDLGSLAGGWDHPRRVCMLAARLVEHGSVDALASVIVHEATHAALWNRGISSEERQEWEEGLCLRVDRRFYRTATGKEGRNRRISDLPPLESA
jgi:hypothetical protein